MLNFTVLRVGAGLCFETREGGSFSRVWSGANFGCVKSMFFFSHMAALGTMVVGLSSKFLSKGELHWGPHSEHEGAEVDPAPSAGRLALIF